MGSFAFLRGSRDGIVKDLDHPDHSLGGEDTWAGRGHLRVVLGTRGDLLLSGDYGRFDGIPLPYAKAISAKPGFSFDNPASMWQVRTSHLAFAQNTQQGASAKLTVQLSDTTTLTSLTAYRKSDDHFFVDRDATELSIQTTEAPDVQRQVSQELTVAQRTPKLAWTAGAFFYDDRDRGRTEITDFVRGVQMRPFSTISAHAWALFGQATYSVSSRVSLTGGMRYSDEEKDAHNRGGTYLRGTIHPRQSGDVLRLRGSRRVPRVDAAGQRAGAAVARHVLVRLRRTGLQERRLQCVRRTTRPGLRPRARVEL